MSGCANCWEYQHMAWSLVQCTTVARFWYIVPKIISQSRIHPQLRKFGVMSCFCTGVTWLQIAVSPKLINIETCNWYQNKQNEITLLTGLQNKLSKASIWCFEIIFARDECHMLCFVFISGWVWPQYKPAYHRFCLSQKHVKCTKVSRKKFHCTLQCSTDREIAYMTFQEPMNAIFCVLMVFHSEFHMS